LKQFTITKIQTTKDGEIVLSGKKGMIRICRMNDNYSSAVFHPNLNGIAERLEVHTLGISELPVPKKGQSLSSNIAF